MKITIYIPPGVDHAVVVGDPPPDQSAVIQQLRDEAVVLQDRIDELTTPPPAFVGPDIVIPAGTSGDPLAPMNVADRFAGTRLIFLDNDTLDSVGLSSEGTIAGTYPIEPDSDDDTTTLIVRAQDPWGRFADSTPIVIVGRKPAAPPPPPLVTGEADSYRIWPNRGFKTGPKATRYNIGLGLRWKNRNGDWLDRNGVEQGSTPWYVDTIPVSGAPGYVDIDVTELAQRWHGGENRGLTLLVPTTTNVSAWAVLAGTFSATPPMLDVEVGGEKVSLEGDLAGWNLLSMSAGTAGSALDASLECRLSRQMRIVLHFNDLKKIAGPVTKATLRLYVKTRDDVFPLVFHILETDAPPMLLGGAGLPPTPGLSQEVGEANLAAHPDVLKCGDFSEENWNNTPGKHPGGNNATLAARHKPGLIFNHCSMQHDQYKASSVYWDDELKCNALRTCIKGPITHPPGSGYVPTSKDTVLPDGTIIQEGNIGGGELAIRWHEADMADPLRPADPATRELEMFQRVYVFFEDSYWSEIGAVKISPVGWDGRYGVWDDVRGWGHKGGASYVFGSGQTDSDGKRYYASAFGQAMYKGHSMRGHSVGVPHPTDTVYPNVLAVGFAPSHLGPYDGVWDEGVYGTEQTLRLGAHCIPKGRWVCMESQIKMNSIDLSTVDHNGNGRAINDGVLRVWLDGVMVGERTNLAWRCHPDMGIVGTWNMHFHGGTKPATHDLYWRYGHIVVARKRIGVRAV